MSDDNPFERPPIQPSAPPPVAGEWGPTTPFNPIGPRQRGPGRGKTAAVALGAVALTGGAIFGISAFADNDDATLAESEASAPAAAASDLDGENIGSENIGSENIGSENIAGTETGGDAAPTPSIPDVFAGIAECIDIEEIFGSMGAGNGTTGSVASLDVNTIGEAIGDTVTITDADGVTVYTLGEGDASIAISKSGGDVTVTASGDVTESTILDFADFETQMNDMMVELEGLDLDELDWESLDLEEILEGLDLENMDLENVDQGTSDTVDMNLDDIPALSLPADFDPAEIKACIESLNLGSGG